MENIYITKIHINKVRHLEDIPIELSETTRKHLILTGKNGSGKTSLLNALRNIVRESQWSRGYGVNGVYVDTGKNKGRIVNQDIRINFSNNFPNIKQGIFVHVPARRIKLVRPERIEAVNIPKNVNITEQLSTKFLGYILHLDFQLYGAQRDDDKKLEANLNNWFENFKKALRNIYNCQELELLRDTKNLSYKIKIPGRESFALDEMSDGYASFLDILVELLMRFGTDGADVDYNKSAVVLIDEIEAHLHVELQRKILPFLVEMFPNVQFIVATHSPFVMTSLENAIVFDLETKERLEKPSFYSYDTMVESFLNTSMYSDELKKYFKRYKELCLKDRTPEENEEFLQAKVELEIRAIPSTELYIAFQQLENERKAAKNGTST